MSGDRTHIEITAVARFELNTEIRGRPIATVPLTAKRWGDEITVTSTIEQRAMLTISYTLGSARVMLSLHQLEGVRDAITAVLEHLQHACTCPVDGPDAFGVRVLHEQPACPVHRDEFPDEAA